MTDNDHKAYSHWAVYDADQEDFIRAVDAYKRKTKRNFPTLCELLAVLKSLGYVKASEQPKGDE